MKVGGPSQVLFERWRSVAQEATGLCAIWDFSNGRRWNFEELLAASESQWAGPELPETIRPVREVGVAFVLELLRGWRSGRVTCPLEGDQVSPRIEEVGQEIAHLKLTSASTGEAKCIGFTAEQLAADPRNIVSTMGLRREWPNLGCISLSHSYGFSNLVLPLVLHGIPLVLVPAPLPEVVMRASAEVPAITLPAVPALWRSWFQTGAIPRNVKLAISAGAPLPIELEAGIFERDGLKVHNFYGSSECGGIAYDRTDRPRTDGSLVGTAMEGVSLSVSAERTLVVESAAVGAGYLGEGQRGLKAPVFETTDLAEIKDGGVYLRGRLSDVINVAGRKASPERIEAALRVHPAVRECVVFGHVDGPSDRYETIVACIRPERRLTIPELTRFLTERLPSWQIPREWWFTEELEANGRGKVSRAYWRERYRTHRVRVRSGGDAGCL